MKCMQSELLAILPARLRGQVDAAETLEIRLRLDRPPRLMTRSGFRDLEGTVTEADLNFCINAASRYSPWNAASLKHGYLTAPGGHRIGVCGETAGEGIRTVTSLCIRVAKDFPGIARGIPVTDSVLLLGPPGSGKTTLLRDLIREISRENRGAVAVVDERQELFPAGFSPGPNTDVLSGCPKSRGIDMVLRSMGPNWVAMDEVTCREDCEALVRAGWCGVKLIATVHAASVQDLKRRPVYRPLVETGLFRTAVVLSPERSWCVGEVGI